MVPCEASLRAGVHTKVEELPDEGEYTMILYDGAWFECVRYMVSNADHASRLSLPAPRTRFVAVWRM